MAALHQLQRPFAKLYTLSGPPFAMFGHRRTEFAFRQPLKAAPLENDEPVIPKWSLLCCLRSNTAIASVITINHSFHSNGRFSPST